MRERSRPTQQLSQGFTYQTRAQSDRPRAAHAATAQVEDNRASATPDSLAALLALSATPQGAMPAQLLPPLQTSHLRSNTFPITSTLPQAAVNKKLTHASEPSLPTKIASAHSRASTAPCHKQPAVCLSTVRCSRPCCTTACLAPSTARSMPVVSNGLPQGPNFVGTASEGCLLVVWYKKHRATLMLGTDSWCGKNTTKQKNLSTVRVNTACQRHQGTDPDASPCCPAYSQRVLTHTHGLVAHRGPPHALLSLRQTHPAQTQHGCV